jgi:16S rRNA (cytosine967-C5)-methyltransferase
MRQSTCGSRLEPHVLDVLRLGAFELLFLRTAPHAAVDEAVSAVKRFRPQAASLVNAVLRRLAQEADSFPWGDPATDPDALARASGAPRWLVDALTADLGPTAARETLAALGAEPPLYGRANALVGEPATILAALTAEGVATEPAPPDGLAFRALDAAAFARSTALARDHVFVCDAAAQYAALQAASDAARTIVEIGAGRGTKTLVVLGALRMRRASVRVVAVEPNAWRARVLEQRLAAAGVESLAVVVADVRDVPSGDLVPESADVVFVDAPCTGSGTLRRHPEAVWRVVPDDVGRLSALQSEMLEAASVYVREGGLLVYSTCSVFTAENGDVVRGFLASPGGSSFFVEPLDPVPPDAWNRFVTTEGFFRSWPSVDGPDGHFVARLRKSG